MEVKLYTVGCPNCIILEKKLKQKNINFETITDLDIMSEKNIMSAPMLEVDGVMMNYTNAIKWLGEQG